MYRTQALDLDHTDDGDWYVGLAHAVCNRRAGGLVIAAKYFDKQPAGGGTAAPVV